MGMLWVVRLHEEPEAALARVDAPILADPQFPASLTEASPRWPWTVFTAAALSRAQFRRVDVGEETLPPPPFLKYQSFGFEDHIRAETGGFVAEDGAVVASLAVISLVLPEPPEYDCPSRVPQHQRPAGRHELI